MLSGLVYCTDCGSRHYLCRCGSWDENQYTFVCGRYHNHKADCTPHTIKAVALRQIVLSEIQRVSVEARERWDELFQRLTRSHQSRAKKELAAKQRELDKGERRLKDLETLFRRSFEELALGHLSNGQFQTLARGYEQEKAELEAKAETLKDEIANRQDTLLNAERFRKLVDKYTDITELTPELVREFVERIEVHERSGRYKKKHYTQQVDIYSISSARHDKAAPGCRNILGPCVEPKTSLSGRTILPDGIFSLWAPVLAMRLSACCTGLLCSCPL